MILRAGGMEFWNSSMREMTPAMLWDGVDGRGGVLADCFDAGGDLAGRLGGFLRQILDLAGHDREAVAVLAGARRLDRGVEG
jgi:hypothetical protein